MRRRSNLLVLLAGAVTLLASPALAGETQCDASQLKEIGRYQKSLYKCYHKAAKSGSGAGACISSASLKFSEKLAALDKKADCSGASDFSVLDFGLQAAMSGDAKDLIESLNFAFSAIEPCEAGYTDLYQVSLREDNELLVRVDSITDAYYFDPGSSLEGTSNLECIAGPRNRDQLMETEFECAHNPRALEDDEHPDGFCPQMVITSGDDQICEIAVFVEGSCESDARGYYRLEVFIDGAPAAFDKTGSNIEP